MNSQSMISPRIGDDTIELQLTPEQLLGLSQAAELALAVQPAGAASAAPDRMSPAILAPQPLLTRPCADRFRLWHLASIAKMAGIIIAYVALAWWGASRLAQKPPAIAAAASRPVVVVPRPVLTTSPSKPTVQIVNPFDATEVFTFPAGTSLDDGRDKVAQILMQRARERQRQWDRAIPEVSIQTASLYHPP